MRQSPRSPRERLQFLNDATARIGASLDIDDVIRAFADAAVPYLADAVVVYLVDALYTEDPLAPDPLPDVPNVADVLLRCALIRHTEPSAREVARKQGAVRTLRAGSPLGQALATGEPVRVSRVDEPLAMLLAEDLLDGDTATWLLDRSLIAAPLRVRGRLLGCVCVARQSERLSFDELDTLMMGQLAAQVSLGVDNARMYKGQMVTADTLQRSMLPTRPPTLAGVKVAHRYLPGSATAEVGGDWFDAIPLPGSRVALVVGDVMGHGIRSAAIMGHLRTAVQTLAALDLPPEQVLRHLDDLAQRLGENHLATCLYAVYDPVARTCTIANAGHIPPVIVPPGGPARLLDLPTGAPVGVGGVAFEPVEIPAPDGGLLVLCTDGLVEVRGEDIGSGLAALCENAATPGRRDLDELCEIMLGDLHRGDREDDVALLLARLNGIRSDDVVQWMLELRPTTPAYARRLIRATLESWQLTQYRETVELLATELVTNAIQYASRPIRLRLLRADSLLCEVTDDDHRLPVLRPASETNETGRGLHVLSHLAHRWGASRTATGKVVWFEQSLS